MPQNTLSPHGRVARRDATPAPAGAEETAEGLFTPPGSPAPDVSAVHRAGQTCHTDLGHRPEPVRSHRRPPTGAKPPHSRRRDAARHTIACRSGVQEAPGTAPAVQNRPRALACVNGRATSLESEVARWITETWPLHPGPLGHGADRSGAKARHTDLRQAACHRIT